MTFAGELVTDELESDGGRQVTAYRPPDSPEAVVFARGRPVDLAMGEPPLEYTGRRCLYNPSRLIRVGAVYEEQGRQVRWRRTDVASQPWLSSRWSRITA